MLARVENIITEQFCCYTHHKQYLGGTGIQESPYLWSSFPMSCPSHTFHAYYHRWIFIKLEKNINQLETYAAYLSQVHSLIVIRSNLRNNISAVFRGGGSLEIPLVVYTYYARNINHSVIWGKTGLCYNNCYFMTSVSYSVPTALCTGVTDSSNFKD